MIEELITPESIEAANRRHDLQHGDPQQFNQSRTRSGWNTDQMSIKGELTDRAIKRYSEAGYYSDELKKARELYQAKKRGNRRREGNFDIVEGRLVYRP